MDNYVYDIETYPNVFTCAVTHHESDAYRVFEASERRNDLPDLVQFMYALSRSPLARMIGFNNLGFDYPVLHFILQHYPNITVADIYAKAQAILNAGKDAKFAHTIWDDNQLVPQVDLFKIHHFDNVAKATGLKMLEYNMRSTNIVDLPFPPGTVIPLNGLDTLCHYNQHDVAETRKFFMESWDAIKFREELCQRYGRNVINYNDTKIGKSYFVMRLEEAHPGICYTTVNGKRQPRQTHRASIAVRDVIFPYVQFERPEFQRIHQWLNEQVITETKGAFDDVNTTVDGFQFDFGTGGIHGSIESTTVYTDATHAVVDLDVTSYYPSLAISNRVYPEHLGELFCDIYTDVKNQRLQYEKGTPENMMFKLALNGVYGDSNNQYGPFYDPKYTMTITINGQLLLCMLAEQLMKIPDLSMVQVNTDGLTIRVPHTALPHVEAVRHWWEGVTGLELEEAVYSRMFIRDVNNYIAEYIGTGKLKQKGAYMVKRAWHQNQSAMVVPKAATAALVHGASIEEFIRNHEDVMDFMLRTKVPRSSRLMWGDQQTQNITRYVIANEGFELTKVMPPTPAQVRKCAQAPERRIGVNKGWKTMVYNDASNVDRDGINMGWYIEEAHKLVDPLRSM